MSRKITIHKYEGNTQWSVEVEDSYGTEHYLGYYTWLKDEEIEKRAKLIWSNEVKPKEDLLSDAIAECIQSDINRGIDPSLD